MDVPEGNPLSAEPKAFLTDVQPQIHRKMAEEILALNGVKFQLVSKIQLQRDNPNRPCTEHMREAVPQVSEIKGALSRAFLAIQETLEK